MKQSKLFTKTKKDIPEDVEAASHKWLLKGDFIEQLSSGIYSFLPLGWRVHQNIEELIRKEMNKIGAQEVFLPSLQRIGAVTFNNISIEALFCLSWSPLIINPAK